MVRGASLDDDDPFAAYLAPPPGETDDEGRARLLREAEARKRSEAIDQELQRQRAAESKTKSIKVLLLGQSESGKSTTLKNFQLMNSSKAFRSERASWRAVVQLNIIRSVRLILDVINTAETIQEAHYNSDPGADSLDASISVPSHGRAPRPPLLTAEHFELRHRLSSVLQIEDMIWRRLTQNNGGAGTNAPDGTSLSSLIGAISLDGEERSVNSTSAWQMALGRLFAKRGDGEEDEEDVLEDSSEISLALSQHTEDMDWIWRDETMQEVMQAHGLHVADMPGFFLDSLDRVLAPNYVPTDDDILKARLKTLGVSEHRFVFGSGIGDVLSHDWRVFDVGGARSARAAWVPYFQEMDVIIFLAPLSAFDQMLAEDVHVNRLEDSLFLWKKVVSHQLLKNVSMILFLNKCDILVQKLKSGIMFNEWVTSYGDKPNTFAETSSYMVKKFSASLKRYSPEHRPFFCHLTSVTNVHATAKILASVRHLILRQILQESNLL